MPLYRCFTTAGSIPRDARPRLAQELTRIHHEVTGAPRQFVHVHFLESDGPDGALDRGTHIHGTIRAGRTETQLTELSEQMREQVARIVGTPLETVSMSLTEVPASWIMEGGETAPEPGQETDWLQRHTGRGTS